MNLTEETHEVNLTEETHEVNLTEETHEWNLPNIQDNVTGVYRAGDGSYIISSECVSTLKSDNMLQIEFEESGNVVCSFVGKRNLESDRCAQLEQPPESDDYAI